RARQNVSRTIKSAVNKIAERLPELGCHLARCIKTGTYCCYTPDPHVTITWHFTWSDGDVAISLPEEGALGNGAPSSHTNAPPSMQTETKPAALPQTAFVARRREVAPLRALGERARNAQAAAGL